MVIVKLMGGLGNQMFQYSAGRAIAYSLNTPLKLDVTYFSDEHFKENVVPRSYELGIFNIIEDFASEKDIKGIHPNQPWSFKNIFNKKVYNYKEPHFHFDTIPLKSKNIYLDGFWQSQNYFNSIDSIIKNEFTFKKRINSLNDKTLKEITNSNSVSVHIRRGDYVSNAFTNSYHGICDLPYYYKAISLIKRQVYSPSFFVFSDEIKWAKENLKLEENVFFISNNSGINSWEDLRLMAACKHNIIANSSFSWWGGWLNPHQNKIVIAPSKWFNNSKNDVKDLIPELWIKID